MALDEGAREIACPACKARFRAKWTRLPVRERQMVRCTVCRNVMVEDKSVIFYHQVDLITDQ